MICFPKREKSFPIRCLAVLGFKNEVPLLSSHLEHDSNSWKCYDYVVVKMVVGWWWKEGSSICVYFEPQHRGQHNS